MLMMFPFCLSFDWCIDNLCWYSWKHI